MIQTGANDIIASAARYGESRIESLGMKQEAVILGTLFYVVRNKEVSCKIDAGRLKLRTDRVILELEL